MSNEEKSKPKTVSTEENIQAIKERIINTNKLLKIFDVKEEENKKAKETIKKLQEELQEAKDSNLRVSHQEVIYKDEITRLNDTIKKLQISLSEKDETRASLREESEKLKSKLASLELLKNQLQYQLEELEPFRSLVEDQRKQILKLTKELDSRGAQEKSEKSICEQLKARVKQLEKEKQSIELKLKDDEVQNSLTKDLRAEIDAKEDLINELKLENELLREQIDNVSDDEADTKINQMNDEIADLKAQLDRSKEQKAIVDQRYSDLENSFKRQENIIKELQQSCHKAQSELENKLEVEATKRQAEVESYKKKLQAAKSLLTKQEHTISELKTSKKHSEPNVTKQHSMTIDSSLATQLQSEIDKLEKAKRVLQDVFTEQQIEIADLKATIRSLRTSGYVLADTDQKLTDPQISSVPPVSKAQTWLDTQHDTIDDIQCEPSVTENISIVKPTKKRKKSTDSSTSKKTKKASDFNVPAILEPTVTAENSTATIEREELSTIKSSEVQPRKKSSSFKRSKITTPPSQSSQDFLLLKNLPSPMSPTLPPLRKSKMAMQSLESASLMKQLNAQTPPSNHDSSTDFKKPDSPILKPNNCREQKKCKVTSDGEVSNELNRPVEAIQIDSNTEETFISEEVVDIGGSVIVSDIATLNTSESNPSIESSQNDRISPNITHCDTEVPASQSNEQKSVSSKSDKDVAAKTVAQSSNLQGTSESHYVGEDDIVKKSPHEIQSVDSLIDKMTETSSMREKPPVTISNDTNRSFPQAIPTDMLIALSALGGSLLPATEPSEISTNMPQQTCSSPASSSTRSTNEPKKPSIPISALTKEDHLKFLKIHMLSEKNTTLLSESDHNLYMRLRQRIDQERELFRKWQYEATKERLFILDENISKQVQQKVEVDRQRILTQYPRYYEFLHTVGLRLGAPSPREPVLSYKQTLLRVGNCHQLDIPFFQQPLEITINKKCWENYTSGRIPNDNAKTPAEAYNSWSKKKVPTVSQDPYVQDLVTKHNVDIVISSGGLSALVTLQASLDSECEIPVVVKEVTLPEGQAKKVIFIDKPLVRKTLTPRSRNQQFFNAAFKSMFLKTNGINTNTEKTSIENQGLSLDNLPHTTPHTEVPLSTAPESPNNPNKLSSKVDSGLTIKERSKNPDLSPSETPSNLDERLHTSGSSILNTEESESLGNNEEQSKSVPLLEPNSISPESMDDTTYTLWTFGNFTVLIRCKIHGFIRSTGLDNKSKLVGIKTKMEYHLDHGFEEVVAEEKARWWIHTFIRGDASLMIARVDALSGRLVKVERRNMVDIIPNGNWPRPHSKLLHYLFTKIQSFTNGIYLITHTKGEINASIFRNISLTDKAQPNHYDLHKAHSNPIAIDLQTIPYIPAAWNGPPDQVPYTFPPRPPGPAGYCFAFASTGACPKPDCKYPHVGPADIEALTTGTAAVRKPKNKKKKRKKNKPKENSAGPESVNIELDYDAEGQHGYVEDDFETLLRKHQR